MIFSPVDEALGATLALALALAGGAADPVDAALADWDDVFEPHATTNAALVPPSRAALRTVRRLNCRGETSSGIVGSGVGRRELRAIEGCHGPFLLARRSRANTHA